MKMRSSSKLVRRARPARKLEEEIYGKIVCAGPEGEESQPNFTDERYWFVETFLTSGEPTDKAVFEKLRGGRHEMATNIREILEHSHHLRIGQDVKIRIIRDSGNERYVVAA
ncbi:MAG: hypothetical protein MI923_20440 [Phycisphaerales bacterium]|nr:hypothetical protein [Phycisphaerales bacterium]